MHCILSPTEGSTQQEESSLGLAHPTPSALVRIRQASLRDVRQLHPSIVNHTQQLATRAMSHQHQVKGSSYLPPPGALAEHHVPGSLPDSFHLTLF